MLMSKVRGEDQAGQLIVPKVDRLRDSELPRVSLVILNWNGRHHLEPCFRALRALDYPDDRYEVVLIDNGSDDGSQAEVRAKHSWVRLVENPRNTGFSAGCNQGAETARDGELDPEVLVFLNNDIHVDEKFLRELVAPIVHGACTATTAKMYSWNGEVLNSAGGGSNFHGIGIQRGYLANPSKEYDTPRKSLFPCGGAMAMTTEAFFDVGGFDEEFFAYYEDVDLGWRSWVLGYEIHYVPSSVCYHHHSSTSGRVPREKLRVLQVRNPQLACFKNYDDETLRKILPVMLALAFRRGYSKTALKDDAAYRIESMNTLGRDTAGGRFWRSLKNRIDSHDSMHREAIADFVAINDLFGRWDHWMARRREIQSRRKRSDEEIFPLFLKPMWCIEQDSSYTELQAGMTDFFGVDKLFEGLTTMDEAPGA